MLAASLLMLTGPAVLVPLALLLVRQPCNPATLQPCSPATLQPCLLCQSLQLHVWIRSCIGPGEPNPNPNQATLTLTLTRRP